jgi:TolB-like protein/class 3 adenylate cyclase
MLGWAASGRKPLSGERVERRLAAILAADVVGYSRLMGSNEAGTLAHLKSHRRELIDPSIAEHKGRIVKTTGDGILIEFPSVVEAVACAVTVQNGMAERNAVTPEEQRIVFRVGINLGDIIIDGDDIHGDGVNIAARLEAISVPGGICISGIVHDQVRDKLDLAFEDMGEQALKNIARPLRVYGVRLAADERTPTNALNESGPVLALPDKPSIAVLPFANMSGDPEQEYFADGMVEEIITALSRIGWLFVIARNSSFTYKGKPVDVRQVGRELGVRYVLEGSVRKAAGRVRITCQLIEAQTGTHLWANRFDGDLADVFDLQDQVAASVAGVIEPALQAAEIDRARHKRPENLHAYDLYLRALPELRAMTAEGSVRALTLLRQALDLDPGYAAALAAAAFCYVWRFTNQWMIDEDAEIVEGVRLARASVAADREDPTVLANAGYALLLLNGDTDTAGTLLDRAVALNPNSAIACGYSGNVRVFAGDYGVAIERCARAMRLSPLDPWMFIFLSTTGHAHFFERRLEEALVWLRRAHQEHPTGPTILLRLASTYAHLGRLDEARATVRRLLELQPQTTIARLKRRPVFKNHPDAEFSYEGLRKAGLPEE